MRFGETGEREVVLVRPRLSGAHRLLPADHRFADALIKAGLSAADAAALAPRIAAEMATEGPLSSTTTI